MRRCVAAPLLAVLLPACTSSTPGGSPSRSPTPAASAEPTPGDRVLMLITEECAGLASLGDCQNAGIACARAYELYEAAKLPADDKYRQAAADASVACEKKLKRESNVRVQ